MIGILVCGDNHFIVAGPKPSREIAIALSKHWSLIAIDQSTPQHLAAWSIVSKAFREELQWAVVLPGPGVQNPAVTQLLKELRGRGVDVF